MRSVATVSNPGCDGAQPSRDRQVPHSGHRLTSFWTRPNHRDILHGGTSLRASKTQRNTFLCFMTATPIPWIPLPFRCSTLVLRQVFRAFRPARTALQPKHFGQHFTSFWTASCRIIPPLRDHVSHKDAKTQRNILYHEGLEEHEDNRYQRMQAVQPPASADSSVFPLCPANSRVSPATAG